MNWQQVVLITAFALGAIVNVAMVGKRREPTTPGVAAVGLITTSFYIWLVVSL